MADVGANHTTTPPPTPARARRSPSQIIQRPLRIAVSFGDQSGPSQRDPPNARCPLPRPPGVPRGKLASDQLLAGDLEVQEGLGLVVEVARVVRIEHGDALHRA